MTDEKYCYENSVLHHSDNDTAREAACLLARLMGELSATGSENHKISMVHFMSKFVDEKASFRAEMTFDRHGPTLTRFFVLEDGEDELELFSMATQRVMEN